MGRRLLLVGLGLSLLLVACARTAPDVESGGGEPLLATVYKDPTWGCCDSWAEYLEENDFTVEVVDLNSLVEIKEKYQVPENLQSCHTAIVDGYVIEGHVPVKEIFRLLEERPDVLGIAVAGMPLGSPGMEIEGFETESYEVVTFDSSGEIMLYAAYPAD